MDSLNQNLEKIKALTYGIEFLDTNKLFPFIDKVAKENLLDTFEYEESKSILKEKIIFTLVSISRKIIEEIIESKNFISAKTEIIDGKTTEIFYDKKKKAFLSSRLDQYPTDDILCFKNKIIEETDDFYGKNEVLNVFKEAYLFKLSHEIELESVRCKNVDDFLDLYNNSRYKDVRECLVPSMSDAFAGQLSLEELEFNNIHEATIAYEEEKTPRRLAELKKLHMIEITKKTDSCNDRGALHKMLQEAEFECVKRIIQKRLVYLEVKNI